jgi:F0F1-type ATP synthase assembly protein I
MAENGKKDKDRPINMAVLALGDGVLSAAVLIVLGVYGGQFLDHKFHTTPWFSASLPLLGCVLGLARLVIKAVNLDKDKVEDEI